MARQTLISVYRHNIPSWNLDFDKLLSMVHASPNTSVKGFLLEQLCLEIIMVKGLDFIPNAHDNAPRGPFQREFFLDAPDWSNLIHEDANHNSCLYLPKKFNFENVDGAVLHLESRPKKHAHLYLIQITIAMGHKESDRLFYERQWKVWTQWLLSHGWTVKSTFLWIDQEQPANTSVARETRGLRSGEVEKNPSYNVWRTGFVPLDTRFQTVFKSLPL